MSVTASDSRPLLEEAAVGPNLRRAAAWREYGALPPGITRRLHRARRCRLVGASERPRDFPNGANWAVSAPAARPASTRSRSFRRGSRPQSLAALRACCIAPEGAAGRRADSWLLSTGAAVIVDAVRTLSRSAASRSWGRRASRSRACSPRARTADFRLQIAQESERDGTPSGLARGRSQELARRRRHRSRDRALLPVDRGPCLLSGLSATGQRSRWTARPGKRSAEYDDEHSDSRVRRPPGAVGDRGSPDRVGTSPQPRIYFRWRLRFVD